MANAIETDWMSSTVMHRVIYRIDTGAIVAIETIWAEEGAGADQPETLFRRLDSMMQGFTARTGPLEVLAVRTMPIGALRVDLKTRSLVPVQQRTSDDESERASLFHTGVARAKPKVRQRA